MVPEKKETNYWFSVQEAAEVLGVTRQAVYAAISSGFLEAVAEVGGKKIKAQTLMGYGIRTGKNPGVIVERIEKMTNVDMRELLLWVLAGLGLILLVKALMDG